MAYAYHIKDQHGQYFVTFTVHRWVDVFTRSVYVAILLESVRYCQKHIRLLIYGWVVMSNPSRERHLHMIIGTNKEKLSDIIRDLKKFTFSKIVQAIANNEKESRKSWLPWLLKKEDKVFIWQAGYHGEEIITGSFFHSKLEYIHNNPVKAGIVEKAEEYLYSSCGIVMETGKG